MQVRVLPGAPFFCKGFEVFSFKFQAGQEGPQFPESQNAGRVPSRGERGEPVDPAPVRNGVATSSSSFPRATPHGDEDSPPRSKTGWRRPRRRSQAIPNGDEDTATPNPFQNWRLGSGHWKLPIVAADRPRAATRRTAKAQRWSGAEPWVTPPQNVTRPNGADDDQPHATVPIPGFHPGLPPVAPLGPEPRYQPHTGHHAQTASRIGRVLTGGSSRPASRS